MTSNIGSHLIQENFAAYDEHDEYKKEEVLARTQQQVFDLLKATIRPEFLNRIDEIIMFTPLSRAEIGEIVHLQFRGLQAQLEEMGIQLTASDEALDWLAQLGYDPQFGARPLKRVIQKRVLNELSKEILSGRIDKDSEVRVDMFDGQFVFLNPKEPHSGITG